MIPWWWIVLAVWAGVFIGVLIIGLVSNERDSD